jgi:D-serine deaminase-like pyridoxal phosphate-dependent protein
MTYEPKPGTPIVELDTPILLLDLDAFEANVQRMARFFADKPTKLRPHSKTHKCPQIARRQLQAGAIGITCAKVSEAEVMARAGIHGVLIANQVVGAVKIDRLTDLARESDLMVVVDDAANVRALSDACRAKRVELRVLVEVEVGMNRCGIAPGAPAVELARQIAHSPGLHFAGLMAYEGHLVLTADPVERDAKVRQVLVPLQTTCAMLADAGLPAPIVSGGGTGTYDTTGTCPPVTEVQAGSYVFMDSTYLKVRPEFQSALMLLSTVVSRPAPNRLVLDAGLKTISKEFGNPQPLDIPDAAVRYVSEEATVIDLAEPDRVALQPSDKARILPTHCCTTVNLHDNLYVVQNGKLVDIWQIAGRGCAQ